MKIETWATAEEAAERVVSIVCERLAADPRLVLGLATGATMIPVYAGLVRRHRAGAASFAFASTFNLDDYVGLSATHPASFHAYMRHHLFSHVDLAAGQIHVPDGNAASLEAEATDYERLLALHPIDLQLLGIGRNGHIAFNEPGSSFSSRTRVVELSNDTRNANAPDFPGRAVPERAITMGIGTILEAGEVVLLATGAAKAAALTAAVKGPIDPTCPASVLQLHRNVRVICDTAAAV